MNTSTVLTILLCWIPFFQDQWKNVYSESAWADRDRWQKSDELIRLGLLNSGKQVADIGCHEGYLSVKLSAAVGSNGKVFAVDVQQTKLDRLKNNLEKRGIENVNAILGDYDNPHLPLNSLDAVFILDTYHEIDKHDAILQHIKAALKSGGRLILCEPIADERRKLSRSEQEAKHELGIEFAIEDLKQAGFRILKQEDPFVDRTKEKGDKMWIIVAVRR